MPETEDRLDLVVVHVLFLDIIGYSKELTDEQHALVDRLNGVVRGSSEFQKAEAANRLLKIPTGDGMALVFYRSPQQPVECALEIAAALRAHPELRVRMGIHSGPVSAVTDLNERTNAAGIGINIAQRVMDCGDAGHILLSKRVAEDLAQYGQWQSKLHDLGETEVKHGVRVHLYNLYTERVGNPEVPARLRQARMGEGAGPRAGVGDTAARHDEGFWVAVLPFKPGVAHGELASLAEGLTEEIATGLSRFSYLRVIAQSSTARYANQSIDVRSAGKELGARYVMEGSLRQAGTRLRISAQLVDASSGAHLWAETFDRDLGEKDLFDVQDEIADRVVATTADPFGVLARSMAIATAAKPPATLTPYEAVLRFFLYQQRVDAEDHLVTRTALEHAVEVIPDYSDAWAVLARCFLDEDRHVFNPRPDALDRALAAAERAVDLDPANPLAQFALGEIHYFRGDIGAFRSAAERAIALNLRDSNTIAMAGILISYAGDWERGVELTNRAMALNPHHAGWYRFAGALNEYRQRRYAHALEIVQKINMPNYFATTYITAIAHAQLGNATAAKEAARRTVQLWPAFEREYATGHAQKWLRTQPELIEHIIEGLELAGLRMQGLVRPSGGASPAGPPGLAARGRPAFVGRDGERSRLVQRLKAAKEGRGGLVLLGGEPGVGKTRLASEILEDGREHGMLALAGHAYEEESAPWVTGREILEEMVRLLPGDDLRRVLGHNASELSRLLPELRRLFLDIPEPEELPPQQQQRFLFRSVVEFLARASGETPMVMLLDDIHWADESSLLLLEYIAPRLPEMGILMIGTYRDVEADMGEPFAKTMAMLVRQREVERIQVRQFDESAVAELLTALGGAEPPADLARAIHRETEGNAFFVEEVFRHLAEEGALFDSQGRWRSNLDVKSLDVPEGVRLVTVRRLERLNEATVQMLTIAAGVGLRFELRVLEAVSSDPDRVVDAVEEAESAQLIRPAGAGREARYEFSHALVRQALLSALSVPRLQRLHLRIADAMERVYGSRAEEYAAELAYQLDESGATAAPERVRRYLRLAGDQARVALATEEALDYYEKALGLEEEIDPAERADLLFKRGETKRALGRWEEAVADWLLALPAFEAAGRVEVVTRICRDVAHQQVWANRTADAKETIARGLRAAGEAPTAGRCRLLSILGYAHSLCAEFAESEAANDEAMVIAERLGDDQLLGGEVLLTRIYLYQHSFRPRLMGETSARAIEVARRSGRSWDLSNAYSGAVSAWILQGRFDELAESEDEIRVLAEREGDLGNQFHLWLGRASLELAGGRLEAARNAYRSAVELCREAGFPWASLSRALQGIVEFQLGEWEAARASVAAAVEAGVTGTWADTEVACRLVVSAYTDPEAAAVEFEAVKSRLPGSAPRHPAGSWVLGGAAVEAGAVLGRRRDAAALYPLLRQWVEEGGVSLFALGLAEKLAGIAAAAGRQWELAEGHFEKAIHQADQLPYRVDQPEVRRWLARMLLDRGEEGDPGRARELLIEARAAYEEIGMPKHVGMVDSLLEAAAVATAAGSEARPPLRSR